MKNSTGPEEMDVNKSLYAKIESISKDHIEIDNKSKINDDDTDTNIKAYTLTNKFQE